MSRSKKPVNPAAQKALEQLKLETAAEMGLSDYKNTYKGALTSADNGIFNRIAARIEDGQLGVHAAGLSSMRVTLHESHVAWATYEGPLP